MISPNDQVDRAKVKVTNHYILRLRDLPGKQLEPLGRSSGVRRHSDRRKNVLMYIEWRAKSSSLTEQNKNPKACVQRSIPRNAGGS